MHEKSNISPNENRGWLSNASLLAMNFLACEGTHGLLMVIDIMFKDCNFTGKLKTQPIQDFT